MHVAAILSTEVLAQFLGAHTQNLSHINVRSNQSTAQEPKRLHPSLLGNSQDTLVLNNNFLQKAELFQIARPDILSNWLNRRIKWQIAK
jgi:hypothetical protein